MPLGTFSTPGPWFTMRGNVVWTPSYPDQWEGIIGRTEMRVRRAGAVAIWEVSRAGGGLLNRGYAETVTAAMQAAENAARAYV